MKCVERTELEQFLRGKLAPERLIAVDEHVQECGDCRAALTSLPVRASMGIELGASLLNVSDCPEYEELSAFVDGSLLQDRAKALRVHANMCEPCARDIESIREMRSHASLVGKVTVRPGASRARVAAPTFWWKRALAGMSVAAAIVAAAFTFGPFAGRPTTVAETPTDNKPTVEQPVEPVRHTAPVQPNNTANVPRPNPTVTPAPTPPAATQVAVLRDGAYQVLDIKGKLVLTKLDGTPVSTAAPVGEKLRTGKVKPAKLIMMAKADLAEPVIVRSGEPAPPPSAPKLVSPLGAILATDKPTFTCGKVDLADSYRISIFTNGGTPVATEISDTNSIKLTQPLARGKAYFWRAGVRFSEGEEWAESAAGKFYVISAEDYTGIQQAKRQLPGSHLALGAAYERAGMNAEAASEYRLLRRQNPKSKLAGKLLHGTLAP